MATRQITHHINLNFLKEISEGSTDLMRDLITLFINQVPTFSEQMDVYIAKREYCTLAKLAHKIKNSVAMMGIDELTVDMKKLEKLCENPANHEDIIAIVEKFKIISKEASNELIQILDNL